MDKIKEFWLNLKQMWKDPKGHAIIELIIGILFFIVIIVLFSPQNNNKQISQTVDPLVNYSEMKSYEYSYISSFNNQTTSFNGVNYESKNIIYINNNKYYIKNKKAYLVVGTTSQITSIDAKLLKLTPQNIYKLINNTDSTKKGKYKEYAVSMYDFMAIYDPAIAAIDTPVDTTITNDNQILIRTYEKDSDIYKVELDITNYAKIVNNQTISNTITIAYTNINNINDFSKDFDIIVKDSD